MARTQSDAVFRVEGIKPLQRMLKRLPTDLRKEVIDASNAIAADLVGKAKAATHTPQEVLAASGLKVRKADIPTVRAGGTLRGSTKVQDVFYGAEFGGQRRPRTMQFQPHRGRTGYFLYPTARQRGMRYFLLWADAVDKAFKQWDNKEALR